MEKVVAVLLMVMLVVCSLGIVLGCKTTRTDTTGTVTESRVDVEAIQTLTALAVSTAPEAIELANLIQSSLDAKKATKDRAQQEKWDAVIAAWTRTAKDIIAATQEATQ